MKGFAEEARQRACGRKRRYRSQGDALDAALGTRHASDAGKAGATALPVPVTTLMKAAAKVMTTAAHRI